MRSRSLAALAVMVSAVACTDSQVLVPGADPVITGPSFAISDAANDPDVQGFWFLPPLAKQVTTEGALDEQLQPSMDVCQLDGNPSAVANPDGWDSVVCDPSAQNPFTVFPAGSATLVPGEHYEFPWNTSPTADENLVPMDPDEFYRINIYVEDVRLGYLDVNPQNPAPDTPGQDFEDLYAFKLGENLPVKVFITPQARCTTGFLEGYVLQCAAEGVIDGEGGVVTLPPPDDFPDWPTLSVVVPPNALPAGFPVVILTIERIDPDLFLDGTGEECLPGFGTFPGFDAPQFGQCLRASTDPELPEGTDLDVAALVEICIPFNPDEYPSIKFDEEQDGRLQIIRYEGDEWQGLPNVDATTCSAGIQNEQQASFFPVPREDGFFRTAATLANEVARWLGPEPLAAHGDIRLAGSTTEFSRFRWGLPGQMIKEAGDGTVIQQLEDDSESYDVSATVKVVDAGSPDLSLPPSTVEGATVHFSGADGVNPDDVTTLSDGLATTIWSVPQSPGVHAMDATALGLLASSVPGHGVSSALDFQEETVTFTATVVGPPASSTQSPSSDTELEGLPGETLTTPLTITVFDENGLPVSGWSVEWITDCSATDKTLCDGSVSGDPTNDDGSHLILDENGQATGYWTLATEPGANFLSAKVGGLTAGSWTATGGCSVTVDGNQNTVSGEWDCAVAAGDTRSFTANISGGETPAEIRWQQFADTIYFLVLVEQSSLDKVNSLRLDFDNTLNGATAEDDAIGVDAGGAGFFDEYLTEKCVNKSQSGCGEADVTGGGTVDGAGDLGNDGTYTAYELSHPLNGGDIRDFALQGGDSFGVYLTLTIGNGAQGNTQFPGFREFLEILVH